MIDQRGRATANDAVRVKSEEGFALASPLAVITTRSG